MTSREPLWDQPNLARDVEAGRYYLPGTATGGRETIVTSPVDAVPQYLLRMPMPGWPPFVAALATAGFFVLLTVKLFVPAVLCAVLAIGAVLRWTWGLDPAPLAAPVDVGGGVRLDAYASGPHSHAWWAMVVLLLVAGSLYACAVASYLYLWTVAPHLWPASERLPGIAGAAIAATALAASSGAVGFANRALDQGRSIYPGMAAAIGLIATAFALHSLTHRDLQPSSSAYGAAVHLALALEGCFALVAIVLALYVAARYRKRLLDRVRRVVFDNVRLFWHYTVGQGLVGLALVHGFPRAV